MNDATPPASRQAGCGATITAPAALTGTDGNCGGREKHRRIRRALRVSLTGLPVACLVIAGCSGGSGSTPPKVAAGAATPTQTATPTSSPVASSPAPASSSDSSGTITVQSASSSETAEFTTLALQGCTGFTTANSTLTEAKVTSNGWGDAYLDPKIPNTAQGATAWFRQGSTGWTFVMCGTDTVGSSIPQDVVSALNS